MDFQEFNRVVQFALKVKEALCQRRIDVDVGISGNTVGISLSHPHTSREVVNGLRRQVGIGKIKKRKPFGCSEDLIYFGESKEGVQLSIWLNNVCRVVSYEDKIIPAEPEKIIPEQIIPATPESVKKIPVWDCAEIDSVPESVLESQT